MKILWKHVQSAKKKKPKFFLCVKKVLSQFMWAMSYSNKQKSYMYNNIKYNQICNFLLLGKVIYYTCNTTMWVKTLAIRLISIYILLRRLYWMNHSTGWYKFTTIHNVLCLCLLINKTEKIRYPSNNLFGKGINKPIALPMQVQPSTIQNFQRSLMFIVWSLAYSSKLIEKKFSIIMQSFSHDNFQIQKSFWKVQNYLKDFYADGRVVFVFLQFASMN